MCYSLESSAKTSGLSLFAIVLLLQFLLNRGQLVVIIENYLLLYILLLSCCQ